MSKTQSPLLASFALLALSACGSHPANYSAGDQTDTKVEQYTYSFDYNGCKTGEQTADSAKGYCENLTNDELNHYCAEWMRKDAFDKGCKNSGVTWQSSVSN